MFVIPKKEPRRAKWIQMVMVGRPEWTPKSNSKICGVGTCFNDPITCCKPRQNKLKQSLKSPANLFQEHFSDDQYEFWKDGSCTRLKRDAVPNIFQGKRVEIKEALQDPTGSEEANEEETDDQALADNTLKRKQASEPNPAESQDGQETQAQCEAEALGNDALSRLTLPGPILASPRPQPEALPVGPSPAKKPRVLLVHKSSPATLTPGPKTLGSPAPAQRQPSDQPAPLLILPPGLILLRTDQNYVATANAAQGVNAPLQSLVAPDYQGINSVLDNDALASMFNLARVEMQDKWVLFMPRTFTVIFGQDKQPIPGVVLIVQKDTGRYYLTVFLKVSSEHREGCLVKWLNVSFLSQVIGSGVLASAKAIHDLCRSTFGPGSARRCTGLNDLNSGQGFDRSKFSKDCTTVREYTFQQSSGHFGMCQQCLSVLQQNEEEVSVKNSGILRDCFFIRLYF